MINTAAYHEQFSILQNWGENCKACSIACKKVTADHENVTRTGLVLRDWSYRVPSTAGILHL